MITVGELGRHLPRAGYPEALQPPAARRGAEAVRARTACVLLRCPSTPGTWRLAGAFGRVNPARAEIRFGPELPLADLATPRGAVVDAGPGEAVSDPVSGRPVRSLAAAPVQAPDADRPEALLLVYDPEGRLAFGRRDLDVLLPFAREVAAVHEAARLHRLQQKATLEIVESLVNAIEAKDAYTRGHSQRVTRLALAVGRELEIPERAFEVLEQAAMLHDIGKIALRHEVLQKPGRLGPVELDLVRQHPLTGAKILEPLSWLREVAEVVLQHHERPDGTGYPMGIGGSDLRLEARILAVADAYDAMTSDRPYRGGMTPVQALSELRRAAGTQFDPVVVEALESVLRREHPEIGAGPGSG
ncbi:HD-GYP domain-containing protein [Deferrisoma palaeochoriense]